MYKLAVLSTIFIILQISIAKGHLEIGVTKSGKPCLKVQERCDGITNATEMMETTDKFVARQQNESEGNLFGVYDCFLDVDTEEYKLVSFKRTDPEFYKFSEEIVFKTRISTLQPMPNETIKYSITCEEKRSGLSLCISSRTNEPNNSCVALIIAFIILPWFIPSFVFIVVITCLLNDNPKKENKSDKIADKITLINILDV